MRVAVSEVGCFAHTLQLAIEDGLKLDSIDKMLRSACKVVSHFRDSVLTTNSLLMKQTTEPKLKLIQDVTSRWN